MIKELTKQNLAHMVQGTEPNYSAFNNELVKKSGTFNGSYGRWSWKRGFESDLTIDQLWELYNVCEDSWK